MSNASELNKAIVAHGGWKIRLKDAIDTGKSDVTPANAQDHHACAFGKWLGTLSAVDKASPHYQKIAPLHEQFHQEAAKILNSALMGHRDEAHRAMTDIKSDFVTVSSQLINALTEWKGVSK